MQIACQQCETAFQRIFLGLRAVCPGDGRARTSSKWTRVEISTPNERSRHPTKGRVRNSMRVSPTPLMMEEQIVRYKRLLEVSKAIASHRNLEELFQDLGKRLHAVLKFTYLSLLLHDPVRNVMRLHTFDMEFRMEESPSAWVWQTQGPLIVEDVSTESRSPRVMKLLQEHGVRSFCTLPLTTPRRRLGAFNLGSDEAHSYRLDDLGVARFVAAQVAVAVENALNYQDAQTAQQQVVRERDRLKLLLDVNNAVVSNLALSELSRAIPTSVRAAMQCDAACLSLPARENKALTIFGLDFPSNKGFMREEMVIPMSGSSPGSAYRTKAPVMFGSAPASLDPLALEINAGEGFQS